MTGPDPRDVGEELSDAYCLIIRAIEGGAFADLGLSTLYPGGMARLFWDRDAQANQAPVYERAEALTGAPSDVVAEVFARLYGWERP